MRRSAVILAGLAALGASGASAVAQFDSPTATTWVSRLVGQITSESGAPTIDSGDEVAAIFGGEVIGLQRFSQPGQTQINFRIYGDDPDTPEKEGPSVGETVTFQFYDSSTGAIRNNVLAVNLQGEVSVFRFEGDDIDFGLPDDAPIPDDLLIPVQEFNLRLTAQDNSPGDGSGGDGAGQGDPDVNADGVIDRRDVALVLRIMVGNARIVTDAQRRRADVNNDGRVSSDDAVLVHRAK